MLKRNSPKQDLKKTNLVGLIGADLSPQSSHNFIIFAKMASLKRKATELTQNPYIDLVDSSDDEEENNQPDVRVFPAPPGYPQYLRPRDEIRAKNGYVFTQADKERKKNRDRCQYERPIPSRGNCAMCGRSGPLGEECSNGCKYESWAVEDHNEVTAVERRYRDDPDLCITEGTPCAYRILLTPKKANMIDAVYWAEIMYQGVHEDQENYREFRRRSKEERDRKHDRIRSDQEKWEDPWVWQFRLHQDCQWWANVKAVSATEDIDLEKPKSGKRHKCS